MTNEQWKILVDVINRKHQGPAPVGFIIDSPWLPGWAGISTLDYYASGKQWFETKVRFFHNDAQGLISTPFLKEIGINLFNFSFEHSISEIRELAGPEVALLGNLPPRDVLMAATPAEVVAQTEKM